jgi:alkylation response protein AidB-like acyl-CoA dehydrogenase
LQPSQHPIVPCPKYHLTLHAPPPPPPLVQVRRFVEEELKPNVDAWIKTGYPMQLHQRAYELGIQGIIYPPAYGGTPPPDFDSFYELIMVDEMSRVGGGGRDDV